MHKGILSATLLTVILVGCSQPAQVVPPPPTALPVSEAPATKACVPGITAMNLPADASGGGITLKAPPSSATPERPSFGYLTLNQQEVGISEDVPVYMEKGGTATVATGEFRLQGLLIPAPSADWYGTHIKFAGVQATVSQIVGNNGEDRGSVAYKIPAGQHGDTFRLTITDVLRTDGSTGDVSVTFCRQTPPTVTASYQKNGQWQPVQANLPAEGPLMVRLTFSAPMLRETVESALKGEYGKAGRHHGDWISGLTWVDDRTVDLTVARPLPVMPVNFAGAQDKNGLLLAGGLPDLYTSAQPQVLAIDPASGAENRIVELQPEPGWPNLSPDGKLLRISAAIYREGYHSPLANYFLINLTTGKKQAIQPEAMMGDWLPSGERVELRSQEPNKLIVVRHGASGAKETVLADLPPIDSYYLSPNGEWVAVLAKDGATNENSYQPVHVIMLSTDGKTRKSLTGTAHMYRPGKSGLNLYPPAWSPDSTRLALAQIDADVPFLMVADTATGTLRTLTRDLPGGRGSFDPVTWTPDGSKMLVGPLLLNAATGKVERRIDGVAQLPYWSHDGQWLLFQSEPWGAVTAFNLRTSKSTNLGAGLPMGWSAEGKALLIRWPGAADRIHFSL